MAGAGEPELEGIGAFPTVVAEKTCDQIYQLVRVDFPQTGKRP